MDTVLNTKHITYVTQTRHGLLSFGINAMTVPPFGADSTMLDMLDMLDIFWMPLET
jgi:hypothetical protein